MIKHTIVIQSLVNLSVNLWISNRLRWQINEPHCQTWAIWIWIQKVSPRKNHSSYLSLPRNKRLDFHPLPSSLRSIVSSELVILMIMRTGVLPGFLFMIYGRVQQPAAAAVSSHRTNEDISSEFDATRRLNRKDVIPWDASPRGLFVKHAHQSFHNWNATGRKELCIWSQISSIFPTECVPGKVETGFPSSDDLIMDRYWTSRRQRQSEIVVVVVTLLEANGSHLNLWLD